MLDKGDSVTDFAIIGESARAAHPRPCSPLRGCARLREVKKKRGMDGQRARSTSHGAPAARKLIHFAGRKLIHPAPLVPTSARPRWARRTAPRPARRAVFAF